jgi:hypothetical protein
MPLSKGQRICNGHRRRTEEPCGQPAVRGRTKCRLHGGLSVEGMAVAQFKHGRYSKSLPARLAQRAAEARSNPQLLSLSDDIAVAETLLAERLAALDTGESQAAWRGLKAALTAFEAAQAVGDVDGMQAHFTAMRQLVAQGAEGAQAVGEVRKLWETRAKLVQTEIKTLQGLQQMVTAQQMQLVMGALMHAVIEAVKKYADVRSGRKILMDVGQEMTRLSTLEER